MDNKIVINPVTRIEGHSRITLTLNEAGDVSDARFHVNEFRGFERFCEGRFFTEMPTITPRICGICPVSHAVSSAKACEAIMRITVPAAAEKLRRLIHLGQIISSHALSFFHLSSPDLLLGWDAPPEQRNVLGVAEKFPDLVRRGIRLRKFGQEISERLTGKKVHSIGIVAGGMVAALPEEQRLALLAWIPEVLETAQAGLDIIKKYHDENQEEVESFASFPTLYLGLVGPEGQHELYDGKLRFIDEKGAILQDQLAPERYLEFIAETPISWSYLKNPYYKPLGERGSYRVGPLARLNVASRMTTPRADAELKNFKAIGRGAPVHGSFFFHYARLIEVLASIEAAKVLLEDPLITSKDVMAGGSRNQAEGIGCAEAPRGILFHHYTTDAGGKLTAVNLLVATGQNNPSMNRSVLEVAKKYVKGRKLQEGALNRVEGAIRCYDPCLSCSTHAIGTMPLIVDLFDADGRLVDSVKRES